MSGVLQAVCTVLPVFGCQPKDAIVPIPQTPAYVADVSGGKSGIDAAAAEKLINDYRVRNGLGRVKLDPSLTRIAQAQATAMAAQDTMSHDLPGLGGLRDRLHAGGYRSAVAAENIGAGQRSLGAVFTSWRESRGHRENLLRADVTQLGIALARTPQGRYKVYWAMIVAAPSHKAQTSDAPAEGQRRARTERGARTAVR
jgi:uncharacterized protein YkwD